MDKNERPADSKIIRAFATELYRIADLIDKREATVDDAVITIETPVVENGHVDVHGTKWQKWKHVGTMKTWVFLSDVKELLE